MTRHVLFLLILTSIPTLAAPPTTAPSATKVLILPFAPVDARDRQDWIGRGVQHSLAADLARQADLQPVTLSAGRAESFAPTGGYDTAAVTALAQQQSARFVIYGTYQFNEDGVRITGMILNAESARPLGSMKVTGSARDAFDLQDALARQAHRLFAETFSTQPTEAPGPTRDELLAAMSHGPLRIAGYRAPSPYLSDATASKLKLQNAAPWDYTGCCYGSYYGAWGWCGSGFGRTPYGVIQSSGSLPW